MVGIYDPDTREFTPSEDKTKANAVQVDAKRREGSLNGTVARSRSACWRAASGIEPSATIKPAMT